MTAPLLAALLQAENARFPSIGQVKNIMVLWIKMIEKASPTIHAHLWTTTSSGASLQVGGETVAPLAMVIKQTDLLFIP